MSQYYYNQYVQNAYATAATAPHMAGRWGRPVTPQPSWRATTDQRTRPEAQSRHSHPGTDARAQDPQHAPRSGPAAQGQTALAAFADHPEVAGAYATLWLRPGAPLPVVKAAYRALASRYHPDAGGDPEAMTRLNHAYSLLQQHLAPAA